MPRLTSDQVNGRAQLWITHWVSAERGPFQAFGTEAEAKAFEVCLKEDPEIYNVISSEGTVDPGFWDENGRFLR